jgi:biopolymer transport protein TolR
MAGGLSGSNRGRNRRSRGLMAEINVTPMIDVMLVLLVIFMVAAPLMTVSVPVDLPKTKAAASTQAEEPLVVSLNAKGKLFLQESELDQAALIGRLRAITKEKPDTRIFVRGDRTIAYGKIMEVLGVLQQAGFTKVALLAQLPDAAAPAEAAAPADDANKP